MIVTNAFVMRDTSMDQAWIVLQDLKRAVQDATTKARYKWLAEVVVEQIDEAVLAGTSVYAPFSSVIEEFEAEREQFKETGTWQTHGDFRFRVALMPFAGDLYFVIACERHFGFIEQCCAPPAFQSFDYWDEIDRPKHVKPAEWGARKKIWTKDLAAFANAPFEVGMTIDLSAQEGRYTAEGVLRAIPDLARRAAFRGTAIVENRFREKTPDIRAVLRYIGSAEARPLIEIETAAVRERLLPVITMEHLTRGVPASRANVAAPGLG